MLFKCAVLIRSLNKNMNGLLVNDCGKLSSEEVNLDQRPRIKAADWVSQLTYNIQIHLAGLYEKKINQKTN